MFVRSLIFLSFLLTITSCASKKIGEVPLENNQRLVIMRIIHENTQQGDWSIGTAVRMRLDGERPGLSVEFMHRDENYIAFTIISNDVKVFGLDDIQFKTSGVVHSVNKFGTKAIASVALPPGNDPVYIGTLYMKSKKKNFDIGMLNMLTAAQELESVEIRNDEKDIREFLAKRKVNGILKTVLLKLPNFEVKRGEF